MKDNRTVVITGIGLVTSLGNNVDATWRNLLDGRSGFQKISTFDANGYPSEWAAEVTSLNVRTLLDNPKSLKLMDRRTRFAVAAAREAFAFALLDRAKVEPNRVATILNSGTTALFAEDLIEALTRVEPERRDSDRVAELWMGHLNPLYQLKYLPNMSTAHVAIQLKAEGPSSTTVFDSGGALQAIGEGVRWIRQGRADVVISGGTDSRVTPFNMMNLSQKEELLASGSPEQFRGPFDLDRSGFFVGEGAGILVLEETEHAKSRGVEILAEVISADSRIDQTDPFYPDPGDTGQEESIQSCFDQASFDPSRLSGLVAGGLGTLTHDLAEASAMKKVVGKRIPITATKGAIGNTFAAASAIDAIVAVKSMIRRRLPPVAKLCEPDPACDLNFVREIPNAGEYNFMLVTARSFSGLTGSLLLGSKTPENG